MRTNDFGGFSTRTCSVDLRFSRPEQFDHFVKAWTQRGSPKLDGHSTEERIELVSVGTTLEHELRHYHDFLLGYASLHNYWLRLQAIMNAAPIMDRMLRSREVDKLVFPVINWARLRPDERTAYLADALGDPSAASRTWDPAERPGLLRFKLLISMC